MHKFGSSLRDRSAVNPKPTMPHHNSSLFWPCEDEYHDGRKGTVMTYFMHAMHLLYMSVGMMLIWYDKWWHGPLVGLGLTAFLYPLIELPNLCILNLTASLTFQICMRYQKFKNALFVQVTLSSFIFIAVAAPIYG